MCNDSSKRSAINSPSKPLGELMYNHFQCFDQIMEKVSTGLEEIGRLSSSPPVIPSVKLSSEHDATVLNLILSIDRLGNDVHEADEAVEKLPREGVIGMLEVAGTPHIEARYETTHDVLFLKSRLRKLEGLVEAMKELVKRWMERRVATDRDNAAVEGDDSH